MNTEFCMSCGSKVEFTLKSPNFCPSCGKPFNQSVTASDSSAPPSDKIETEESVPHISKLEYSIERNTPRVTFGDLAAQASTSQGPYEKAAPRPVPKGKSGDEIFKSTLAECSSAREPTDLSG